VKAFLWYAGVALAVVLLVVLGAQLLARPPVSGAIAFSAGLAYLLQLGAFGALLRFRGNANLFTAAWAGGMALRFMVLGAMAFWLSRSDAMPLEAALVSLVGVMFVLVLLEGLFLRWETRS